MIRLAMTRGRIQKQVTILLGQAGFDLTAVREMGRELVVTIPDDLEIIFGKADDVITFLEYGVVDS